MCAVLQNVQQIIADKLWQKKKIQKILITADMHTIYINVLLFFPSDCLTTWFAVFSFFFFL